MKKFIITALTVLIFTYFHDNAHANTGCQQGPGAKEHTKALMFKSQGDYAAYLQWQIKASDKGYKHASYELAQAYYEGKGTPKNYSTAIHYFSKYPDLANSAYMIGIIFREGENGVQKSTKDAIKWLTYYTEIKDEPTYYAPLALAEIYENGELTGTPDIETAAKWYKKAKKAACSSKALKFERYGCKRISAKVKELNKKEPFLDRFFSIFSLD
jgi:TPR repeat protein